jgi:hypothetical protein
MGGWLTLRPTFEIPIDVSRELAMRRLYEHYVRLNRPSRFFVHGEYGELHLPTEEHRLWSPHLTFYIGNDPETTSIHGRFAPRLEIWTFVWVLYLAMAFTSFFSFAMAFSQWAIGESSQWQWLGFASALAIVAIYVVAQLGQYWSADQMECLKKWLDEIIHDAALIDSGGSNSIAQ